MGIGGGNRRTRENLAKIPLRQPRIPLELICDLTLAAAVRSLRLTTLLTEPIRLVIIDKY
jgi:hypothetical protein